MWRIYYADGETHGYEDEGPPPELVGVVGIVQTDVDTGRSFWKDCDFYWWEAQHQCWVGGDLAGLLDYLGRTLSATVLQGRTVPDHVYRRIVQRMQDDPDFPPRSAWHARER